MYNFSQSPQPPRPGQPYIGIIEAVKICLNKYAVFYGRATRAEYWWWFLASTLVSTLLGFSKFASGVAGIALLIPTLAVSWRRMHDIGKGGGWYFINLIPLVGWIIWIVWCCQPSEPYPNRFGEEPGAEDYEEMKF